MQFDVMNLATRGSTQPYVAFSTLGISFLCLCFWQNTHGTKFSHTA